MKPNCKCKECSKEIYKKPCVIKNSNGNIYCSQQCFGKSNRIIKNCTVCGKQIAPRKNTKTCSRSCGSKTKTGMKYNLGFKSRNKVKNLNALRKDLINCRGTSCERCGMPDHRILVIHHKIRRADGGSDELSNLELICPNCHAIEHCSNKMFDEY